MPTWEIDSPRKPSFDDVRHLRLRTLRGNVHVVGTDEPVSGHISPLRRPATGPVRS